MAAPILRISSQRKVTLVTPMRLMIVGSSHTGKTFSIYKLILKGVFGPKSGKGAINISVFTPNDSSANQSIWRELSALGYQVSVQVINKSTPNPFMGSRGTGTGTSSKPKISRLVIIDDANNSYCLPDWVFKLFEVDSHHLGLSVCLIAHKLKTGAVTIRNCIEWLIIHSNNDENLSEICKANLLDKAKIQRILSDPKGIKDSGDGQMRCFNSCYVRMGASFGKDKLPMSNLFVPLGITDPETVHVVD